MLPSPGEVGMRRPRRERPSLAHRPCRWQHRRGEAEYPQTPGEKAHLTCYRILGRRGGDTQPDKLKSDQLVSIRAPVRGRPLP